MAEILEIYTLCDSMNKVLKDKEIRKVLITQPRCSNVSPTIFQKRTRKAVVVRVYARGKWMVITLSNGENILISLGVGGVFNYFQSSREVEKGFHAKVIFKDRSGFGVKFRWFGRFYLATDRELIEDIYTKEKGFGRFRVQTSYITSSKKDPSVEE